MSLVDGLPIGDFGLGALVTLVLVMIFTGRLVPKRFLDDAREDIKALRDITGTQAQALTEINAAVHENVELGRVVAHIVRDMQARRVTPEEAPTT